MPALITLDGLSQRAPDGRRLFDNLTLAFGDERTGVVGANGVGKTTLLRLMTGELAPTAGAVSRRGRLSILRQALKPPHGATVADLLGAAEGLARLTRLERGEGDESDLAEADWTLETRLASALAEVGLPGLALDRPALSLSGGEVTRAALAGLVAAEPDMLILDEPTNNLDAQARGLVADLLKRLTGGAVVVSHDRNLLRCMDRIVDLSPLGARVYGGGYDLYAERKAAEDAAAQQEALAAERAVERAARDAQAARERQARRDATGRKAAAKGDQPKIALGFHARRAEATSAKIGKIAEKIQIQRQQDLAGALARLEGRRRMGFDLPATGLAAGRGVLELERVGLARAGRAILEAVSLKMVGPERVAVTGPNGSGKTTLLGIAAGEIAPDSGRVSRPVAAAVFDQQTAILREDETLLEAYGRLNPGSPDHEGHAALATFLFRNSAARRRVGELSGGERLRAALACVLAGPAPPQLLILDEPTNHLDLDSVAAVEAALAGYDGALIVVSHDRDFLGAVGITREIRLG